MDCADMLRVMTVVADASALGTIKEVAIELPPEARVLSYTLSAKSFAVNPVDIPATLATLRLQDSSLDLPSYGCPIGEVRADLSPPPAFPSSASLTAQAGVLATLHVSYGHCKP